MVLRHMENCLTSIETGISIWALRNDLGALDSLEVVGHKGHCAISPEGLKAIS